jgi:hypothetical protein
MTTVETRTELDPEFSQETQETETRNGAAQPTEPTKRKRGPRTAKAQQATNAVGNAKEAFRAAKADATKQLEYHRAEVRSLEDLLGLPHSPQAGEAVHLDALSEPLPPFNGRKSRKAAASKPGPKPKAKRIRKAAPIKLSTPRGPRADSLPNRILGWLKDAQPSTGIEIARALDVEVGKVHGALTNLAKTKKVLSEGERKQRKWRLA